MKRVTLVYGAVCFLLGAALFGGGAAYAAGILAERSPCTVYVDGVQTELDAYLIDGSNYVKLRDLGRATNSFNVYWDGTVQIESGRPYTGEAPDLPAAESHADGAEPNPSVFTSAYTPVAYHALREAIAGRGISAPVPMSQETREAMQEALAAICVWPVYHLKTGSGGAWFTAEYPEAYAVAADYCQPFIDSLAGQPEAEKARELAFFLCDRLTYDAAAFTSPRTVLISDAVSKGNCMSYAHNYLFLCDIAGIPCILVHSTTHQWNEVYVDGRWYSVDVCATDAGDEPSIRPYQTILWEPEDMQGDIYRQTQPELTAFVREVLVPGSSK